MINSSDYSNNMEPTRHSFVREDDGRRLYYYIFPAATSPTPATTNTSTSTTDTTTTTKPYPVFYYHGSPGSGIAGLMCAAQVAHAGGQLFALDRPGVGYTDPLPNKDYSFESCCEDVWALAVHLKWERFSAIGASGGGPHTLALVASYLERKQKERTQQQKQPTKTAQLERVAIVGGICCSAGTVGMMPLHQRNCYIVDTYYTSRWSQFLVYFVTAVTYILFHYLPTSLLAKTLPAGDQHLFHNNPSYVQLFVSKTRMALRQGVAGTRGEALRALGKHNAWEAVLQKYYRRHQRHNDDDNNNADDIDLPEIHIFHGERDDLAPLSHAYYMYETLLGQHARAKLHLFPELGHNSMATDEVDSYVKEIMMNRGRDCDSDRDSR